MVKKTGLQNGVLFFLERKGKVTGFFCAPNIDLREEMGFEHEGKNIYRKRKGKAGGAQFRGPVIDTRREV